MEELETGRLEELETRIANVERRQQLLQRTDPAVALGTDLHSLGHVPAARVYRTLPQTIPNTTATVIAFGPERYDNDGIHDSAANTSRLTAPVSGIYQITGQIAWAANATGVRQLKVTLNGATDIAVITASITADAAHRQQITTLYKLEFGDYVELAVYQSSGGNLNVDAVGNYTPCFMLVKVAEAGQL